MSTEAVAVIAPLTADEVDLVKQTIAVGATEAELRLFFYDCRRQGVHPLDRLIHFSVRTNRSTGKRTYTPITSIDVMRMRAHDTGECAGIDDPAYGQEDDDKWARVTVYRLVQGIKCGFTATARWSEYYPGDGPEAFMWRKMPTLMLGKCAEALALRKAFPKQLHGLYERTEMHQAGPSDGEPLRDGPTVIAPPLPMEPNRPGDPVTPQTDPESHRAESETLLPTPEDDERTALVVKISRVIKERKIAPQQRAKLKEVWLGDQNADPMKADVSALAALLRHLEATPA